MASTEGREQQKPGAKHLRDLALEYGISEYLLEAQLRDWSIPITRDGYVDEEDIRGWTRSLHHADGPSASFSKSKYSMRRPDVAEYLMNHTWAALLYAIGCVLAIYILRLRPSPMVFFLVAEIPTLILAILAVAGGSKKMWRVALLWALTASVIIGYKLMAQSPIAVDVLASSLAAILLYFLARSVIGSVVEARRMRGKDEMPVIVAWMLSLWGATLQVAFIAIGLLRLSPDRLGESVIGEGIGKFSEAVRFTSPLAWLPSGVLLLGLMLFTSLLLSDDPYSPPQFSDISLFKRPRFVALILQPIRFPLWLVTVIFGFVVHFVAQFWLSVREFLENWMSRLLLVGLALLLPTAVLLLAHLCTWTLLQAVSGYLETDRSFLAAVAMFFMVHVLAVVALSLYAVCPAPLLLDISPCSLGEALRYSSAFMKNEGSAAAGAVVRAFSLFGILILAVPVGVLFHGLSHLGLFSWSYVVIIASAFAVYLWREHGGAS